MNLNHYPQLFGAWMLGCLLSVLPFWVGAQTSTSTSVPSSQNASALPPTATQGRTVLDNRNHSVLGRVSTQTLDIDNDNKGDNGGQGDGNDNGGSSPHNTASTRGTLSTVSSVDGTDIYASNTGSLCPKLFSNVSLSAIDPCSIATAQVSYCNHGTADAHNAYIDVALDPLLVLSSAVLPYTHQGGNVFRFQLGTVVTNDCQSFDVLVQAACDTTLVGDEVCVGAHIYPDTLCTGAMPSRPLLLLDGSCLGSSVKFRIDNRGGTITANDQVRFTIIEDHLLAGGTGTVLRQGTLRLARHAVQTEDVAITHPAHTHFRLELRDGNNRLLASSAIQNCNSRGRAHTINYYAHTFWNGSPLPAISSGCAVLGDQGVQANVSGSTFGTPSGGLGDRFDPATAQVRIAPNPVLHQAVISLENADALDYVFEIYDATGQRVYTRRLSQQHRFTLERGHWAAGLYYYRLLTHDQTVDQGKLLLR